MYYFKHWSSQRREIPLDDEFQKKKQKAKLDDDLAVIRHFDGMYQKFQSEQQQNRGKISDDESNASDSSKEEATDIMEILNKEPDKLTNGAKSKPTKSKKLNPYAHAHQELKKSRVISKRLNTLSIFVKKDTETGRQHDGIYDDEDKEPTATKGLSRFGGPGR